MLGGAVVAVGNALPFGPIRSFIIALPILIAVRCVASVRRIPIQQRLLMAGGHLEIRGEHLGGSGTTGVAVALTDSETKSATGVVSADLERVLEYRLLEDQ